MEITELTVHELQEKLRNKELTVSEITKAYVDRINEKEKDVNAFITLLTDEAVEKAKDIEEKINNGEINSELAGIPIGIKDAICTKGVKTTAGSKMLGNFVAPYDATVMEKINSEGMINLGKSIMGILTGSFENISQIKKSVEKGGLLDSISSILDTAINWAKDKGYIKKGIASEIKKRKKYSNEDN